MTSSLERDDDDQPVGEVQVTLWAAAGFGYEFPVFNHR
jgi:hypothetical protein